MAITFKSKIILTYRKIKKFVEDFNLFILTGLFMAFILMCFMVWWKALVIGIFGYLIYLKLEHTMVKIFRK